MLTRHVIKHLSAYCNGELTAEESRRVSDHLLDCARCRDEYEEVKLGVSLAESLPRLTAPESIWGGVEPLLGHQPARRSSPARARLLPGLSWPGLATTAGLALLICAVAAFWYDRRLTQEFNQIANTPVQYPALPGLTDAPDPVERDPKIVPRAPDNRSGSGSLPPLLALNVERLAGVPRIGAEQVKESGRLGVGEWLVTDDSSRARIEVADIGHVEVEPNSRISLVATRPTEHRLSLAQGELRAQILAPPRLFFVDTPSAVAIDYGCAYTLKVDKAGGSVLHVTSGWVAMVRGARESLVPAGAYCVTRPGIGPGAPYFDDASQAFLLALHRLDFDKGPGFALDVLLAEARERDTLTLWHLLARVDAGERERVYDRLSALVPPPDGVTREGVLALDKEMLQQWMDKKLVWAW